MPSEITFETLNCEGTKYIYIADPTAEPDGDDKITFVNDLNGNVAATVSVYAAGDKGGVELDFCEGLSPIEVPGTGGGSGANEAECQVKSDGGIYQYEVAADSHVTLDPVIIVEPKISESTQTAFFATSAGMATMVVVLVAATFVAYQMGKKKGAQS